MIDLPLIALGGVLGSSHCVGMCGGFAVAIGLGARSVRQNLARQLVYCSGRVFTYAFLGSAAGFAGAWFTRRSAPLVHAQAVLSLAAGVLLMVQGAWALGLFPRPGSHGHKAGAGLSCLASSFLRPFLSSPRWHHVFVAGVLNGALPCGLVYGYLALASSTASFPSGLLVMVALGLGTMPVMVLTGAGASVLSFAARQRLWRVSGVCVLLTGLLALGRGLAFWSTGGASHCPACEPGDGSILSSVLGILGSLWR